MTNNKNNHFKYDNLKSVENYLDVAGVIIVILDNNGKIVSLNKKGYNLLGYRKGELLGKDWFDTCLLESEKKQVKKIFKEIVEGKSKQVEYYNNSIVTKKGEIRQVLWHNSVLKDKNGLTTGVLSSGEDVTERNQVEQNLCKSQERFENLSNLLPQTIFEVDSTGKLIFVNRIGFEIFGYTSRDFSKGIYALQIIAPVDRKRAAAKLLSGKNRKNSEGVEYLALKKDGSTFPALIYSNFTIENKKPSGMKGVLVDITNVKQAESRLKETVAKDEALLKSIADGVIAIDNKAKIILINDVAKKLLGYSEKEAIGKKWCEILKNKDENGLEIPCEKSEFEAALTSKNISAVVPYYYEGKNGKKFPVARTISPIVIGKDIVGAISTFRDITTEKELDRAKTDFLSLVSHQLRTPLSAIKWTLELVLGDEGFTAKQREHLNDIYISNARLIGLVNSLLDVTRIQAGKQVINKRLVVISDMISQMEKSFKPNADKKNQKINIVISPGIKPVMVDSLLFGEAFNNLINNAIKYGLENSSIDVSVKPSDGHYVIAVHNFGPVIPKSDKNKVFTRFYRGENIKDVGSVGSGLGLFIAKAGIEANGGSIWFESTVKNGTTFFFTVPK